ncbi:hypothetical protein AALO_G00166710 [Alosa alosa]|uniref:Uncharacterized protein n=1 Tax=Alosa alosa TaxID=278164 RepID=A0AAV6GIB7_9TELE|nr:hypothetical protein AALO_G00166710 [Alosa alosa]
MHAALSSYLHHPPSPLRATAAAAVLQTSPATHALPHRTSYRKRSDQRSRKVSQSDPHGAAADMCVSAARRGDSTPQLLCGVWAAE